MSNSLGVNMLVISNHLPNYSLKNVLSPITITNDIIFNSLTRRPVRMPQVSKSFRVFSEARRRKQLTRSPGILIFLKPLAEESSIGIGQQNNVSSRSISSFLVVKLSIQNFFSGTQILKLKNQSFVLVNLECVPFDRTGWLEQQMACVSHFRLRRL